MTLTAGFATSRAQVSAMAQLADHTFFDGDPWFAWRYPRAFGFANRRNLARAMAGDDVVSAVASYPADLRLTDQLIVSTVAVGSVCTREDHRGRGLSSWLLRLVEEHADSVGSDLLLISGEGPLYQRLGARSIGHLDEVLIGRNSFTSTDVRYQRHTKATTALAQRLHADQRARLPRFLRSVEEFADLLAGHLFAGQSESAVVLVPENAEGYAVMRTNYEGTTKVGFIVEWAGDFDTTWSMAMDEALATGCDRLFTRADAASPVSAAWSWAVTPITITGTVKLVNPSRFLAKVAAAVRIQHGCSLDHVLCEGMVELRLDGREVFCGPPDDIPAFLWGVDAPPELALPSFRVDNLNFL